MPEYILLSDEIGKWGGDIEKAKLPDEFLVDYVRVYDLVAGRSNFSVPSFLSGGSAPPRPTLLPARFVR